MYFYKNQGLLKILFNRYKLYHILVYYPFKYQIQRILIKRFTIFVPLILIMAKYYILLMMLIFGWHFSQNNEKKLDEIVIKSKIKKYKSKKENPAYAILKEVWKKKKNNALDKFQTYQFDEYEKIEYDFNNIDSAFMKKKIFNKMDFIFNYTDSTSTGKLALPIFLNEALYKNYGENKPSKRDKKILIAQKTSGFQNNEVVSIIAKNLFKDTNILDNTINFFNIGVQNPISSTGFSTYDYNLLNDTKINGEDCYKLQYEPKFKEILAFKGFIYISKKDFSLAKMTLRSSHNVNINFVNNVYAEYEFTNLDNDTFLPYRIYTEFDMSLSKDSENSKGITAKRSITFTNYNFNQNIDGKIFKKAEEKTAEELAQSDEFWENTRTESLNKSEQNIYKMLDELNKIPKFQQALKLWGTIGTGYYNIDNIMDIGNLYRTIGINEVEGTRLQFGGRTFFSQNDMWRIQGYGAYGLRDKQFKYAFEAKTMLDKVSRFQIGIGTRRDVLQTGAKLTPDEDIIGRSFASSALFQRGDNGNLSNINQINIFSSIEPIKNLEIRLDGVTRSIQSANPQIFNLMYYKNNNLRKTTNDSYLSLSIISKPKAKYSKIGIDRKEHPTLTPTLILKYTHGFEGLFGADFEYNKLQLLYHQPILVGNWGKSIITIEAGKNFNAVPISLQNIIPANQSYTIIRNTFSQLNYYEFIADTYATLHYEHHFNGKILSRIPLINKLKLREVGIFRAAYGGLSDTSKIINVNQNFSAPDQQIYYEYGFGIENIGFGNFRLFRIDFNWRGNYLSNPNAEKFGIKLGFKLGF